MTKAESAKSNQKEMSIKIGSVKDDFGDLKVMSNDKSVELLGSLELNCGERCDVAFWTSDIPELICVSHFVKDINGSVSFRLDFSKSTI